jgi:peptidoglycan/LPS O-acetylase OafA/YrhL/two-component sensor histidine kinase
VGHRAVYALWGVFCGFMTVVEIQDNLYDAHTEWWEPWLWQVSSLVPATLWLLLALYQQRYSQFLQQPLRWLAHHLKWLPLVALTCIAFMYSTRHGVYALLGEQYDHESWSFVVIYESVKLVLFAGLWLGILFAFESFEQWSLERQRLAQLQRSLVEAQLTQLKSQLRPHFLFNALNTISALMHSDVARADHLLAQLSELLRSTLRLGDQQTITLREELQVLRLYAQIMTERFSDRVELRWQIAPDIESAQVPALLLQPLLENAFKHGVEPSRIAVQVEIIAHAADDHLHLQVRNTGELCSSDSGGVGLRNGQERLRLLKPYDKGRLNKCLDRVRARLGDAQARTTAVKTARTQLSQAGRLMVPVGEQLHLIDVDSIEWLEADDNYVHVHAAGGNYLLRRTLGDLPESHNLIADWYLFNHYLLLTLYGFLLASMPQVWDWFEGQRRITLLGAVCVAAVGIPLLIMGVIRDDTALDSIVANVFTWLGLMALLGYGRRYLSRSNRLLEWARDASYPIYILHQSVIVAVGYFAIQQAWHPWVKFAAVVTVTFVGCALIYEFAIRRSAVLRLIFGMKPQAAPTRQGQVNEIAPST